MQTITHPAVNCTCGITQAHRHYATNLVRVCSKTFQAHGEVQAPYINVAGVTQAWFEPDDCSGGYGYWVPMDRIVMGGTVPVATCGCKDDAMCEDCHDQANEATYQGQFHC